MAVRIRLTRTGARNAASFRVVAADSRSPRDGRFLEILGWYDPRQEAGDFKIDTERVAYWVGQGAEVSETVNCLIKRARSVAEDAAAADREVSAVAAATAAPAAVAATDDATDVAVAEPEAPATVDEPADADRAAETAAQA
jgi:small subunit ribosomal protein S16